MTEKSIKEELRAYSERYCANELVKKGFTSYRDDLINWYKVYNGIICHVHLVSLTSQIPTMMMVWRIHPTYISARLNIPAVWMRLEESDIWFFDPTQVQVHLAPSTFVIGGGMNHPEQPETATDRLIHELFPQIERLQSREKLYEFSRNKIITKSKDPEIPLYNLTQPDFADEALIMEDSELFPDCIKNIEIEIPRADNKHPFRRSPELLEAQLKALRGENVSQYLEMLKERKEKFLKQYKLHDDDYEL